MGDDRDPTGHLLLPKEAANTGNRIYLIEFLAKGVPREHPNNPGHWWLPQTDGKDLSLKTIPAHSTKHGEIKSACLEPSPPLLTNVHGT